MNRITHNVFALILALHYVWLEVVEAFHAITTPLLVTSVDADSSSLQLHDAVIIQTLVEPGALVPLSSWVRAATTEWPQQLPAVIFGVGGRAMKS